MNIKLVKNRYINALLILVLFSAAVHMLVLFFVAITSGDFYVLNYFNILDIDYLVPGILNSPLGNAASLIFAGIIYLAILRKNKIQ